eukprot:952845-Rhodomonas_salina.1
MPTSDPAIPKPGVGDRGVRRHHVGSVGVHAAGVALHIRPDQGQDCVQAHQVRWPRPLVCALVYLDVDVDVDVDDGGGVDVDDDEEEEEDPEHTIIPPEDTANKVSVRTRIYARDENDEDDDCTDDDDEQNDEDDDDKDEHDHDNNHDGNQDLITTEQVELTAMLHR